MLTLLLFGRCIGPKRLIGPIHQLLPYVQFCASTVIQEALARSLSRADEPYEGYPSYYDYLKAKYTRKRDLLVDALTNAGFAVPDYDKTPGGGFFIFARAGKEVTDIIPRKYLMAENKAAPGGVARQDWALCQWMAEEVGLLCIPSSPFFSLAKAEQGASDSFVRIAFCKTDETIEAAAQALQKLKTIEVGAGESCNATVTNASDLK
jgi:kynurenine--oxoglutarate transaminase/cysteine-S-conjugate beta-lyase/glutamine--phenylpyruvate transaminase